MHTAVIGTQWGDEGKGKIADYLARRHSTIVRYQGGNNAGHTVVKDGVKFPLHLLPSGILYPDKTCVIGDGVVINPLVLATELKSLTRRVDSTAKLLISPKAHLIMPWHVVRDGISGGQLGTTGRGIGPTYSDATARLGIRVGDLSKPRQAKLLIKHQATWNRHLINAHLKYHRLKPDSQFKKNLTPALDPDLVWRDYSKAWRYLLKSGASLTNVTQFLISEQQAGRRILFEGAQATLLDITHGDYPYVTSSHPTLGGLYIGTGFRPRRLHALGVVKAYATRVGAGPFPTELSDSVADRLRQAGHEFGTTTGRPRRCGWLDLVALKYAVQVNGLDSLAVTKLDVLSGFDTLKLATAYRLGSRRHTAYPALSDHKHRLKPVYHTIKGWTQDITGVRTLKALPQAATTYLNYLQKYLGIPIKLVGVGPDRSQIITR